MLQFRCGPIERLAAGGGRVQWVVLLGVFFFIIFHIILQVFKII